MGLFEARPFAVNLSDEVLAELKEKLEDVRLPETFGMGPSVPTSFQAQRAGSDGAARKDKREVDEWYHGMSVRELAKQIEAWRGPFLERWREREAELNKLDQFMMEVEEGAELHFIFTKATTRPERGEPVPIILCHGWPSTGFDFARAVPEFAARGFDVVVPSICGYGFSRSNKSVSATDMARLYNKLMVDGLGYEKYVVQGGDWGGEIASSMAAEYPGCVALHTNLPVVRAPRTLSLTALNKSVRLAANLGAPWLTLNAREAVATAGLLGAVKQHAGYFLQNATKPDTIGHGLNDSPAGLLAYVSEKYHYNTWAPEEHLEELLTMATIFWATRSMGSSLRLYREVLLSGASVRGPEYINVPTALLYAPGEVLQMPRALLELSFDVRSCTVLEEGGHFLPVERPAQLAEDVAQFVFHKIDYELECTRSATRNRASGPPLKKQLRYGAPLVPVLGLGATAVACFARSRM